LHIDLGLGYLKITFEDLIAAFIGSLDVIFGSRIIAKIRARKAERNRPSS